MRADRLLRMVLLLQARGRMTGAALAEELEVSVRTIYRDLEALDAAGIPVYAEPGPGGGCQLVEGYRSSLAGLTKDEAAALLTLGVPAVLNDLGIGPTMRSAHERVRAVAGIPNEDRRVHLDMPRWFHQREDTPHLAALADAIDTQRLVAIGYRSNRARAAKSATVNPLGLVNKAGVWYLIGVQTSGRMAVYRAGRIETLRVLDQTFARPPDFDLVRYWEAWSADFESSLPTVAVTVRASPTAIAVMPEILGAAVLPALDAAEPVDGDGWRRLVLTFEHDDAAAFRLAGFGGEIEVLSPRVRSRPAGRRCGSDPRALLRLT